MNDTQGMPKKLWIASATKGYQAATYQLVGRLEYYLLRSTDDLIGVLGKAYAALQSTDDYKHGDFMVTDAMRKCGEQLDLLNEGRARLWP